MRWRAAWEARRPIDEAFAWACLVANVVGVPGVGTLMARRRIGILQAALAVAGGILLTWWIFVFLAAVVRSGSPPPEDGPGLRMGLEGIALFGAGWIWSIASSVAILREARRSGHR
jgi:hypothetical protein